MKENRAVNPRERNGAYVLLLWVSECFSQPLKHKKQTNKQNKMACTPALWWQIKVGPFKSKHSFR